MEIWKKIVDYETYSVSNLGNVKNNMTERILKGGNNGHGYLLVCLWKNGVVKKISIHRLVALAFIENPDDKKCVDHIDGNPLNNLLTNLRFATSSENNRNAKMKVTNTSGVKGVSWFKQTNKWCAQIQIDGKKKHLGYFAYLEDATVARQSKSNEIYGEFAHPCEKILEV